MPNKLEDIIKKHPILSAILKSCRDLRDEGNMSNIVTAFRMKESSNFYIDKTDYIDVKYEDQVIELLTAIASDMIVEISNNLNGIVLNDSGTINRKLSIEQAIEGNIGIPQSVKELTYKEYKKRGCFEDEKDLFDLLLRIETSDENFKNFLNEVPTNDYANVFGLYNDIEFGEDLINLFSQFQANQTESRKSSNDFITSICDNNTRIDQIYTDAVAGSWLNSAKTIFMMQFFNLKIRSESNPENNVHVNKKIDALLKKNPEFEAYLDEDGNLIGEARVIFANYVDNLTRAKTLDYIDADAKNNISFFELDPEEKRKYIRTTMLAYISCEPEIKQLAMARLISMQVIKQNENGTYALDEEKLLDLCVNEAEISNPRGRFSSFNDILSYVQKYQRAYIVDRTLTNLVREAINDNLVIIEDMDRKEKTDLIEQIRMANGKSARGEFDLTASDVLDAEIYEMVTEKTHAKMKRGDYRGKIQTDLRAKSGEYNLKSGRKFKTIKSPKIRASEIEFRKEMLADVLEQGIQDSSSIAEPEYESLDVLGNEILQGSATQLTSEEARQISRLTPDEFVQISEEQFKGADLEEVEMTVIMSEGRIDGNTKKISDEELSNMPMEEIIVGRQLKQPEVILEEQQDVVGKNPLHQPKQPDAIVEESKNVIEQTPPQQPDINGGESTTKRETGFFSFIKNAIQGIYANLMNSINGTKLLDSGNPIEIENKMDKYRYTDIVSIADKLTQEKAVTEKEKQVKDEEMSK